MKEDIDLEPRRCAIGARQAGRHPVAASLRDDAQGVTQSIDSVAFCPGYSRTVLPTAREIQAQPQAQGLLRRAHPHRGYGGISRSPGRSNLELGWRPRLG